MTIRNRSHYLSHSWLTLVWKQLLRKLLRLLSLLRQSCRPCQKTSWTSSWWRRARICKTFLFKSLLMDWRNLEQRLSLLSQLLKITFLSLLPILWKNIRLLWKKISRVRLPNQLFQLPHRQIVSVGQGAATSTTGWTSSAPLATVCVASWKRIPAQVTEIHPHGTCGLEMLMGLGPPKALNLDADLWTLLVTVMFVPASGSRTTSFAAEG